MSMLKRTLIAAGALAAFAVPALAAEVKLEGFHANPAFARFHGPIAEAFMKKHPEIEVTYRATSPSYNEAHQQILRSAVTNELPDFYFSGYHLLPELVETLEKRDQIVDLGSFLTEEGEDFVTENYAPRMLALGQIEGKQWGLAFNASSPLMYYNADLVKQAGGDPENMPSDWESVMALAAKINTLGDDITGISYDVGTWPDDWLWQAALYQQGARLFDGEGDVAFGNEAGLKSLELFRTFVTDGGMQILDWNQSRQQFGAGKTGIFFTTPAHLTVITDMVGDKFALRTAPFPLDDKGEMSGVPTGGNAVVMLTKDEAKQKAAWEYIKFATGPEAQKIVVEMTGYLPTNLRTVETDYLGAFYDANPNYRTAIDQIDRSLPWVGYPGGQSVRVWNTQREIIAAVMRGEKTPEEGLEEMVQATSQMMN
ncbi:ABC transporter substrate-binding protein [Chelativorans salis]|uniref:ABC transporter substrate-binding protein n=1 Tax=Chelativorans salis TaxID=2978478 RepID=A0ABT2LJV3_9HYPH|nr:ABC transporter substrate-binding protein [Chelativorans sp. EGI FJ00035]MCT7374112.1 ABC transporter substrate-binding protein [Chelativorans sp. EGI FJ00035]